MTKFFKWGDRVRQQQEFDRKTITLTKAGQTYNVYDAIQEANVDTDPVEVMKKYHCNQEEAIELMVKKGGMNGIYGEFAELQQQANSLPELFALKEKAEQTFANLPSEIREKYGNNLEDFIKDLNQKATEINKKKEEPKNEKVKEEPKNEN